MLYAIDHGQGISNIIRSWDRGIMDIWNINDKKYKLFSFYWNAQYKPCNNLWKDDIKDIFFTLYSLQSMSNRKYNLNKMPSEIFFDKHESGNCESVFLTFSQSVFPWKLEKWGRSFILQPPSFSIKERVGVWHRRSPTCNLKYLLSYDLKSLCLKIWQRSSFEELF